jgi:hypothetical protein
MVIMYNVGSAGTVDPGDIAKVECIGSIIQLRGAPSGVGLQSPPPAAAEVGIPQPEITATIRYAVSGEFDGWHLGDLMFVVRYRPGNGNVVAVLNEVPLWSFAPPGEDPGTVTETTLLTFDAVETTDKFLTSEEGGPTNTNANHVLNFTENFYYVALTLSAPERVVGTPPAVAAIELVQWVEF